MADQQMVMYEEEFRQIAAICERLTKEANAKAVLLVDKNGQYITSHGETTDLDTTSLASLAAGTNAATNGLAKIIGEKDFPNNFLEGEKYSLHTSLVAGRAILVVIFDQRSSLGLVRLRMKRATEELANVFGAILVKAQKQATGAPFGEITDDDIDNLFSE
jgi:predicted regulator of Ras-like GTPase activity (Roadblock/LC7/MglB family)